MKNSKSYSMDTSSTVDSPDSAKEYSFLADSSVTFRAVWEYSFPADSSLTMKEL
jgi:hypothetical protein